MLWLRNMAISRRSSWPTVRLATPVTFQGKGERCIFTSEAAHTVRALSSNCVRKGGEVDQARHTKTLKGRPSQGTVAEAAVGEGKG